MNNVMQKVNEKIFVANQISKGGRVIDPSQLSDSVLRSTFTLGNTAAYNDISFNRTKNGSLVIDRLLEQNDAFVITRIGLHMAKVVAAAPTDAQIAATKWYPYANPFVFDGATESLTAQSLYNAIMRIRQNTDVAFPFLDTKKMEFVPDSQEGNPIAYGTAVQRQLRDSRETPFAGLFPVQPILVKGTDQIRVDIVLPASVNITEANEVNYGIIIFDGFLVSGLTGK